MDESINKKILELLASRDQLRIGQGNGIKSDGSMFVSTNEGTVKAVYAGGCTSGPVIVIKSSGTWYAIGDEQRTTYENTSIRRLRPTENLAYSMIVDSVGLKLEQKIIKFLIKLEKQETQIRAFRKLENSKVNSQYISKGIRLRPISNVEISPHSSFTNTLKDAYFSFSAIQNFEKTRNRSLRCNCNVYGLVCKPKVLGRFVSVPNKTISIASLMNRNHPEYKRTDCELIAGKLDPVKKRRQDIPLISKKSCDHAIAWRLVEIRDLTSYGIDKIKENGDLFFLESGYPSDDFDVRKKTFRSRYSYPGYMQFQAGCRKNELDDYYGLFAYDLYNWPDISAEREALPPR